MKTQTDSVLPTYQVLGQVLRINYNEQRVPRHDMQGNSHTSYEYTTAISQPSATRGMLIEAIISSKYTTSEEISIINNQILKPNEYSVYQNFRAQAKSLADGWLILNYKL